MREYLKFYIDGSWVDPVIAQSFDVLDPATERVSGRVSQGSATDIDRAVKAARSAFASFSRTSREYRVALFERILAEYEKRYSDMAAAISEEMGAPSLFGHTFHTIMGYHHLKNGLAVLKRYKFDEEHGTTLIVREPIGVCGIITPWNMPANDIACKVAPALAVGCTVVLKPSEFAPFSAQIWTEVMHAAGVPAGVFNLVHGDGPTVGAALSRHPDVDMVAFTGSTAVGIEVARNAAPTVKRVHQELGGKSANLILEDADFPESIREGVRNAMGNSGQSCNSPCRMLIPNGRMTEAVALIKGFVDAVTVGHPASGAMLGPVASATSWGRVQDLIMKGIEEGATLLAGGPGRPDGLDKGYYVKPTVFTNVTSAMTIARQEIFGPVLVVMGYDTVAEAIQICNDSPYGLAAFISGTDRTTIRSVAKELRVGQVTINFAGYDINAPFGGYKMSGNGRKHGEHVFGEFVETKAVLGCARELEATVDSTVAVPARSEPKSWNVVKAEDELLAAHEVAEIEAILEECPGVQRAVVVLDKTSGASSETKILAYVVPDSQAKREAQKNLKDEAAAPQVTEWKDVFDRLYVGNNQHEADFNISIWNSSYTGQPLPVDEMREWVDSTVERIFALEPRKVLEIGCGTGLLLSRIAPACEQYWGTDFSATALEYVASNLVSKRAELSHVKLLQAEADDFSAIGNEKFDVIVINSVVQYFPDHDYLVKVLRQALALIDEKGSIFIGDVRNLTLLKAFVSDVELDRAPAEQTIAQFKQQVVNRMWRENELLFDPQFFLALQTKLSRIGRVECLLRRGRAHNELTRFRYDVVLHVGDSAGLSQQLAPLDWRKEATTIDQLRQVLMCRRPETLAITNIPNLRLAAVNMRMALLTKGDAGATVEEVRRAIADRTEDGGPDPESWWEASAGLPYTTSTTWMGDLPDGDYEVVFRRIASTRANSPNSEAVQPTGSNRTFRALNEYVNSPLIARISRQLLPKLRRHLKGRLPDYMLPNGFIVVGKWPVNAGDQLESKTRPTPELEAAS